jgi:hypothetical protein
MNNNNLNKEVDIKKSRHKRIQKFIDKVITNMPKIKKTKKHQTVNYQPYNNNNININNNNNNNNNNKSINRKNNYISKLVDLYYDNDKASDFFLQNAHRRIHTYPTQRRIIVIGDIHGDLDSAIKCLIIAKCIKPIELPTKKTVDNMDIFFSKLEWTGEDTFIVQLGDQIDRVRPQNWDENDITNDVAYQDEGSTLEIFYLFYYLGELAAKSNGQVISIIGNHEIMNTEGDFRYVSLKEFKCFKDHLENIYTNKSKFPYHSRTLKRNKDKLEKSYSKKATTHKPPVGFRERLYAFSPTGLCANLIALNNYTMVQIGNWLFCHGSPVEKIVNTYSIDLINNVVSMYLLGMDNTSNIIEKHYIDIALSKKKNNIMWSRRFGSPDKKLEKDKTICKMFDDVLDVYNNKNAPFIKATHLAIGHTPQFFNNLGINSICNNRVWRCDVGMSRAFGANSVNNDDRQPQVLEILYNGEINILK